MSERQTPLRFQIAPDPQTAHLPLDHPIRRRSLLLSLAGAAALQACGGDVVGSGDEAADAAALADEGLARAGAQAATATPAVPYAWTNLVPVSMYERTPLPVMDGCGLLSFQGKLWLIGGWWPYAYRVQREIVNGVERIKRNPDGSIQYAMNDFHTQGFIKRTTNAVWCSSDGITWDNVKPDTYNTDAFNPNTDWAGRHAFGCVVFQNRMWIIGGDTQHIGLDLPSPLTSENYSETTPPIPNIPPQNDIWSSADGVTWRKEGNLPFVRHDMSKSTRIIHSVLAFNNALWLIGGNTGEGDYSTHLNDVWKSTNGKTWTRVLANMPNPPAVAVGAMGRWKPRTVYGHTVVHNNRMWILGGASYVQSAFYNDVWSSADGVNWRLELANDSSFANTTRWMGRLFAQTASFDGKLWIFTGVNPNNKTTFRYPYTWDCRQGATPPPGCEDTPDLNGNQKDVWHSTDGKQWTKYSQEMIDPRHAPAAVVHGNALVVATGGWNDCWTLSPYVWERVPQRLSPHFGASYGGPVAVSNGSTTAPRMWMLGANNGFLSNAVWSSPDGGNWTQLKADTAADWSGRYSNSAVFFNNRIWVIGGYNGNPVYLDDVWSSADGKTWRREATGVACLKRLFQSVVVFNNKIWMFGGQNAMGNASAYPRPEGRTVYYNDVWNTSDGKTWSRVTAAAPWAGRGYIYGSVVFNNRLWVIGGGRYEVTGAPEVSYNDVWSTADGVTWTRHTANAPWVPRRSHQVCVFDKRMWVLGGWSQQRQNSGLDAQTRDIWYSSDGANWAQLPVPSGDVPGGDSAIALLAGVPHLVGGQAPGGISANDVWCLRRRDGKV